jgi:predicted ribosome quality control (RQC) complex YloA/Tae2 family protein
VFPRRAALTLAEAANLGLPAALVSDRDLPALEEFAQAEGPLQELLARAHRALVARTGEEALRREAARAVSSEVSRLVRLRANLLREQGAPGEGPRLRRTGEAILSNLHQVRKGTSQVELPDWSDEGAVLRIALDPAKTPAENAQVYFHRARRWERGEPHRKRRLELIDRAVAQLSVLAKRVEETDPPPRDAALERRIAEAVGLLGRGPRRGGAVRASAGSPAHAAGSPKAAGSPRAAAASERAGWAQPAIRPREFKTTDGWTVLVGRSNTENDLLTHKVARQEDYWFHAHGVPGSHVVLRREGRKDNPSARTIEEAASIAAYFSKARHSSKAPVIYTLKKYVRKPRGGKPGLALCTREKTVMVPPRNPAEGQEPEWMEE